MRIVSGTARGRKLQAPPEAGTRPTSDRVREAVFDMLSSMDVIESASVLDLFAGSGALGIECLSRGAASAVLVDQRADAVETIRRNLAVLGDGATRASVVRSDALTYLRRTGYFDLVLADPPYAFDRWGDLLVALRARAGLLVAETGFAKERSPWSPGDGWETVKVKRYGDTVVSIVKPIPVPSATGEAEEGQL